MVEFSVESYMEFHQVYIVWQAAWSLHSVRCDKNNEAKLMNVFFNPFNVLVFTFPYLEEAL